MLLRVPVSKDGTILGVKYSVPVTAGIDNPIVWYEGSGLTDRRYLMADERGSVVSVTDSAGSTIAINSYDDWGIPAPTNAGRFGYTGQTWLPELKLWYYKARMYSPTLGRFMQTDPIGYADGMNWYAYVGNDPVNFVDPFGLAAADDPIDVWGKKQNECVWPCRDGSSTLGTPGVALIFNLADYGVIASGDEEIVVTANPIQGPPEYCESPLYLAGRTLDRTGELGTTLGLVTVAAGAVQVAATPVTAGVSGVTGTATAVTGGAIIGGSAASQVVGKGMMFFAEARGNSRDDYPALNFAANSITLVGSLSRIPNFAIASAFAGQLIPPVGGKKCKY